MVTYSPEMVRASSQLQRYAEQRRQIEDNIRLAVAGCREDGLTWAQIGTALGVSSQAAWEHYGLSTRQRQQRSRQSAQRHTQLVLLDSSSNTSERADHDEPPEEHRGDGEPE